ncbi:hypothetical protein ACOSQ3_027681 [Xanthoceras sorbifolium]
MLSAVKIIEACYTSVIAEAVAIQFGMKLATEFGLLPAIIESDSLSVTNLILDDRPIRSEIGFVIKDILDLKVMFGFPIFFPPRSTNRVAHILTKIALGHTIDLVLLEEVPSGFRMLVQEEAVFS